MLRVLLVLAFLLAALPVPAQAPPSATPAAGAKEAPHEYSLPPDKLQKAIEYSQARYRLHFAGEFYGIAVLLVILAFGISARLRDWAEAASSRRFLQATVFVPLLFLVSDVLSLPVGIYGQHLELRFEQSIQSWPSWFWDWTKSELISFALAILLVWLLYAVIRRSSQRWWFYFWLASLPIIASLMYLEPYVIEPLFYHFDPLAAKQPALADQLEKVVARAGLAIPRDRMFEMKASEKVTSLNAYVSGFGGSKRIVVWDTTIDKLTTPEILFVFGHEMGHYVLNHIRNSLMLAAMFLLVLLFIGYHGLHSLLRRYGPRWRIRDVADWASLPVLLLIVAVLSLVSEPLTNGYSRWQEHQADIYGLEVTHGIVQNSAAVASHAFQVLGEVGLDEPNPNGFIEFWLYSHPSISERVAFAQSYDPWSNGTPKYVK